MADKKTHDEYVAELKIKNPTVEVVEEYINARTPILHHCLVHDVFWKTLPSRALMGAGCNKCKEERFHKTRCKTHEQYVDEVFKINPDIVVTGTYINARTPIEHYCKQHGVAWMSYPDNILRGIGCKQCGNEKIKNKNIKLHDEYVKELNMINPDIEVVGEYMGANTSILHKCKIDGHMWNAKPANILSGKGCPCCVESHGERYIRQWLQEHNIIYSYQKIFDDCKNKRPLPFDFYIPEYNVCIEYDGEQHFKKVDHFGGEVGLKQRQYNDNIKTSYCKNHNIHLLRIPYYKNVEEELEKFFIH